MEVTGIVRKDPEYGLYLERETYGDLWLGEILPEDAVGHHVRIIIWDDGAVE